MSSDTELAFFCLLIKQGSLVATARELNLTPPAVSRRLTQMEERLRGSVVESDHQTYQFDQ